MSTAVTQTPPPRSPWHQEAAPAAPVDTPWDVQVKLACELGKAAACEQFANTLENPKEKKWVLGLINPVHQLMLHEMKAYQG